MDEITRIMGDVAKELERAMDKHQPPMASAHEGYAVLLEEVDELWDEIKKQHYSTCHMRMEAVHVAAMAIRFIHDVCDKEKQ